MARRGSLDLDYGPIKAAYDYMGMGYRIHYGCGCGATGRGFVPIFQLRSRGPLVEGWQVRDGVPRCPDCQAAAADRIAEELLALATA